MIHENIPNISDLPKFLNNQMKVFYFNFELKLVKKKITLKLNLDLLRLMDEDLKRTGELNAKLNLQTLETFGTLPS